MAVKSQLRFAAATDPGKRRKNNEDRYYVDPERGIYAVIDGVGGHVRQAHNAQAAHLEVWRSGKALTVTLKLALVDWPQASNAVAVTVVVPMGK